MKKNIFFLILTINLFTTLNQQAIKNNRSSAVTFALNGGRLGDNLLNYWRARYFAYKNDLSFLCPHFNYKTHFNLHKLEYPYTPSIEKKFRKSTRLKSDKNLNIIKNNILYKIDFYFKSKHGSGLDDQNFIAFMKKMISSAKSMPKIKKKQNRLNIAIHVRYGSGYDLPFKNAQKIHPLKFPPLSYYIQAIHKIRELTDNQPLHIVIFTDAKNSKPIIEIFKQSLSQYNITIDYRNNNKNAHKNAVIHDFFSMAQYDYLIRSGSGLSRVIQLIGNHKIVISPSRPIWKNKKLIIGKLSITDKRKTQSI